MPPFNSPIPPGQPYAGRPSDKFCVMNREFYKELKLDVQRIMTAVNVEQATDLAKLLLQKLEDKFENKEALRKLKQLDAGHPIIADPRNAPNLINPNSLGD